MYTKYYSIQGFSVMVWFEESRYHEGKLCANVRVDGASWPIVQYGIVPTLGCKWSRLALRRRALKIAREIVDSIDE